MRSFDVGDDVDDVGLCYFIVPVTYSLPRDLVRVLCDGGVDERSEERGAEPPHCMGRQRMNYCLMELGLNCLNEVRTLFPGERDRTLDVGALHRQELYCLGALTRHDSDELASLDHVSGTVRPTVSTSMILYKNRGSVVLFCHLTLVT